MQNVHLLCVLYTVLQKCCLHHFYTNMDLLTINSIPLSVLSLLTLLAAYSGQQPQVLCHLFNEIAITLWLGAESCVSSLSQAILLAKMGQCCNKFVLQTCFCITLVTLDVAPCSLVERYQHLQHVQGSWKQKVLLNHHHRRS